ncbi:MULTISPECIES: tripartite tricarboxylate transporter substrate binding protein [Oceanisphaera]|uniref:Tripartite tricarboxylate transporter substrate binding protein n=1 Tax=Oceanisphaera ostreae TaxID=914151 RepID=A0ABW3KHS4_9GAMM
MKLYKKLFTAIVCSSVLTTPLAIADDYPEKPVTMIVAYSPGGGNDTVARLMAKHIEPYLGARMVVENASGAGGQIGFTRLAKTDNDGYTVGLLSSPSIFMIEMLRKNVAFTLDDFQAIANIQSDPILLAVNAKSDYQSFEDFAKKVENNAGSINVSGDGPQSNIHLQAAALEDALSLDINFVSYSGSGPSATALLGNEVEAALLTTSSALAFIESGRIRPLAVFAPERHPALKELPTINEASGTDVADIGTAIRGVASPAGVSKERVEHLEKAFESLLKDEDFIKAAQNIGITLTYQNSEAFEETLKSSRDGTKRYIDLMK